MLTSHDACWPVLLIPLHLPRRLHCFGAGGPRRRQPQPLPDHHVASLEGVRLICETVPGADVVRTDQPSLTRVLAVGLDTPTVRRWLGEGALVETAPDLLQAIGRLWEKRWDVVVVEMGDPVERDLQAWLDAVNHTEGRPLLIAVVKDSPGFETSARPLTLAEVEARHIREVLEQTGGRITETARVLGVHRNTLARKVRAIKDVGSRPGHTNETPITAIT